MKIVKLRGNRKAEISAGHCVFGVAAVHCVSGEDWVVTQVLHSTAAVFAPPVRSGNPGDTHPSAGQERILLVGQECPTRQASRDHLSHDLVAGNNWPMQWCKLAFDDVKIGAAHAASSHPQKNFASLRLRHGNVFNSQRRICNTGWSGEHCGFHSISILARYSMKEGAMTDRFSAVLEQTCPFPTPEKE